MAAGPATVQPYKVTPYGTLPNFGRPPVVGGVVVVGGFTPVQLPNAD